MFRLLQNFSVKDQLRFAWKQYIKLRFVTFLEYMYLVNCSLQGVNTLGNCLSIKPVTESVNYKLCFPAQQNYA